MQDNSTPALHAYQTVKKRILDLTYPPGERLSEVRLAEDLGLGRSPIRTALARLKNDGWISVSPKSGTYVKSLSDSEIKDLLDLRLLLETQAAYLAATHISDAKLRELRRAFDKLRPNGARASTKDDLDAFIGFDSMFHGTLYRATGNALLKEILQNLSDKVQWIKTSVPISPQRIRSGLLEMERILAALETRNPRAAAKYMREHIGNAALYAAKTRQNDSESRYAP